MPKNITIQKILGILLHRLPMILMAGVLGGLVFFVYTSFAIKPVYSTSSMIYIQNYGKQSAQNGTDDTQGGTSSGASSGNSEAIQSNNAVAQKIFNSDLAGSAALASNCITLFNNSNDITRYYDGCSVNMSTAEDTFYITIDVSGNDPVKCANVANIVAEKCAPVFNTLIGVVVGIILACVVAIVMELIDTTIKSDDDLSAMYKIPVFAEIPDFENVSR